jgi:hypothetical protein
MKFSQGKSRILPSADYGSARLILLVALGAILSLTGLVIWSSRPAHVLAKRQASLLAGMESRSGARIARLLAEDYQDRWGFQRNDAVEALLDAGSQFLTLVIKPEDSATVIEGDRAKVTTRLYVSGQAIGPVGHEVTRTINQLKEPFVFTWEKQGFLPSSWRLVSMENPSLPTELHGYTAGDLRQALRGEE